MATKLEISNIQDAKSAIAAYRSTCDGIFQSIQNDINNLVSSGFIGDAANGYKEFFDTQITPALTARLTGPDSSITAMLESLLTAVEQMLNPVDPDLANANRTAAG